ncbi:MAG: DegV family protein [Actinomycetes bacterium]
MNLNASDTAVVLDSTADFPDAHERFPNWRVVPLYVNFGTVSYRDGVDIGPDEFYKRLAASAESPRTSQPTPADFLTVYDALAPTYPNVISLQLSSTLSGTFASAQTAAGLSAAAVRVFDTRSVAAAVVLLGLAIQRRLEAGTTDQEIAALVDRFCREHRLFATFETLEYLARGGRIGRAAAFAGGLLNVQPILSLEDGELVPFKRVRGGQKAIEELGALLVAETADTPSLRVAFANAAAPERLAALEAVVRRVRPHAQVEVSTSLGAVVGTHAGPGALGLFWFDDPEG